VRKIVAALTVLCLVALLAATADARKRHNHKPAGVKGVVLNSTCAGPCTDPTTPPQPYTGPVTVTVAQVSGGTRVASQAITDGRFRFRLARGVYDVSSVPPNPPVCQPQPAVQAQQVCPPPCTPTKEIVCPLASTPAVILTPCLTGETKRIAVRRHHFTYVELHVTNVCVV
jgi:hypothetical protein